MFVLCSNSFKARSDPEQPGREQPEAGHQAAEKSPARIGGQAAGGDLTLKQSFQMITGTLKVDGKDVSVSGRLRGDQISFKAGEAQYTGTVTGNSIKGAVKGGAKPGEWTATRKGAEGK